MLKLMPLLTASVLALAGFAAAAPPPCAATPAEAALERQALAFLNAQRANRAFAGETKGKAAPLKAIPAVAGVARCHSKALARAHALTHAGSSGADAGANPGARLTAAGVAWRQVGENVAMAATLAIADANLMNEPPDQPNHRANILNPAFTEVGIGIVRSSDGLLWITEDFLRPPPAAPYSTVGAVALLAKPSSHPMPDRGPVSPNPAR
ncbi:MAG: CAP domain-containing protein [Terriglobales bacterium]